MNTDKALSETINFLSIELNTSIESIRSKSSLRVDSRARNILRYCMNRIAKVKMHTIKTNPLINSEPVSCAAVSGGVTGIESKIKSDMNLADIVEEAVEIFKANLQ